MAKLHLTRMLLTKLRHVPKPTPARLLASSDSLWPRKRRR